MVNITSSLRVINGTTAADREANGVLAEFAAATETVSTTVDRMSAFIVIAFDDHGFPTFSHHIGKNFPIPTPMLPAILKDIAVQQVYGARELVI
jgi:hypothetical protein